MATSLADWIARLPKAELHCHMDLVIDLPMLRELERRGYALPASIAAVEAAAPVHDYQSFWEWLAVMAPFEGSLERLKLPMALHLERLKAQNVVYAEWMIGKSELPRDRSELLARVRDFRSYITSLEEGRTQVEFLVALGRNRPLEMVQEAVDRVLLLFEAGLIVGVGFAGPEQGYPIRLLRPAVECLREAGVPIEVHAGEWAGPESVRDALEYGSPARIGHGLAVFQDTELLRLFQERQIPIEFCPTSNFRTGALRQIAEHPLRQAQNLGLNFCLNSDDPGPFECSVESEYRLAAEVFGLSEPELLQVTVNAVNARFQPVLRYPERLPAGAGRER